MKTKLKIGLGVMAIVAVQGRFGYGQAVPAGVANISVNPTSPTSGSALPSLDGVLHYALSASEIVQYGYFGSGEVTGTTALSGDVAYSGKSTVKPFSLLFAGGLLLPNQTGQGVSTFQNVAVSQGLVLHRWIFNVADTFSFLPESPTTGLSGVAGVGDLGAYPVQGPGEGPAGGVFSVSGNRISNYLSGSVEHTLDRSTSISGSGSWGVLHFLDDNANALGLDSNQYSGVVSLNRRLDQRSSASVNAVYSVYEFSGVQTPVTEPGIETKGLNFVYQRTLNRAMAMSVSIGPQWVSSTNSLLIPNALDVAVSANLSYTHGYTNASLSYTRGVNSGSGVLPGALSDSITFAAARSFHPNWVVSTDLGYTHSNGLTEFFIGNTGFAFNETFNTIFGGAQVTRRLSQTLSAYASYTAQSQSSNNIFGDSAPIGYGNALNGTSQTFGIGVTWSPHSTRLGQF